MKHIDLNCDMGESFGAYTIGMDGDVIRHITSANIACGFHAGDPVVMARTVALAAEHGVAPGAHPGFPDLMGFGRRNMQCSLDEVRDYIIYQVGAINAFCTSAGVPLQHVKPHGSLYNMAVGNEPMARAIAEAVASVDASLILLSLAGKHAPLMRKIADDVGITVAFEAFPDRAYSPDGVLAPRSQPGAVITDGHQAAERALRMASEGTVVAVDGSVIEMDVSTLCVHGDNPEAVSLVRDIRKTLESEGVSVVSMGTFVGK